MALWPKETLNLQVGAYVIWQDKPVEMEGGPLLVSPGTCSNGSVAQGG